MFSREVTEHGYVTYPRRFEGYKWYNPIITAIVFGIFFSIFMGISLIIAIILVGDYKIIVEMSRGGYDSFNTYTAAGIFSTLVPLAVAIPALMLTAVLRKDRPFSSYSSSRGGWNWKIFLKMMIPSLILFGIPNFIFSYEKGANVVQFTVIGFILATIFGPLQCVAEEYMFRSLIMQTVGSWFRIPILAIIIQVIIFASLHPYNIVGVAAVAVCGLGMGLATYLTKGLEASSASHIVNNMVGFYMVGFGIGKLQKEVAVRDLVIDIVAFIIYIGFIIFVDKKYHWFDEVKKDDVAIFNEKKQQKVAKKAKAE